MFKWFDGRARVTATGTRPLSLPAPVGAVIGGTLDGLAERVAASGGSLKSEWQKALRGLVAREVAGIDGGVAGAGLAGSVAARRHAQAAAVLASSLASASAVFESDLRALVARVTAALPREPDDDAVVTFEVAAIDRVAKPAVLISNIVGTVVGWSAAAGTLRLGSRIAADVRERLLMVSGLTEEEAEKRPQRLIWPDGDKGSGAELVERYLSGTPLADVLLAPVKIAVPMTSFFEHAHVMAKPGHGKTQLAEYLIGGLLDRDDFPSIVVVDSQGELLPRLARLACFAPGGKWHRRLIYLDPREMERPIALNPFLVGRQRRYEAALAEQMLNGTIQLLEFIMSAVLGAPLTQRQTLVFRYVSRLLMTLPGASVSTMTDVLTHPERYEAAMQALDGEARRFFDEQFFSKHYAETRQEIARRLWGLLEQEAMARLLLASENRLDFFTELQAGRIIAVDTAMDFLKEERSAIMGRTVIAMVLAGIFERAAQPRHARRPTFLILDEAHDVLDDSAVRLLVQARKYAGGVMALHQMRKQLPAGLLSALGGVSVKLAGKLVPSDLVATAEEMNTSVELLQSLGKVEGQGTEFALKVANRIESAVKVRVPFGSLDRRTTMSEATWRAVYADMLARYGAAPSTAPSRNTASRNTAAPTLRPRATSAKARRVDDDDDVYG